MTTPIVPAVRLIDGQDGPDRTAATLVASLRSRLAALYVISGADAIGSMAAGIAALGQEMSRTAKGALLRKALESSRAGTNGEAIWSRLGIGAWVSSALPSSPLGEARNDFALLLTDDLQETLELPPMPPLVAQTEPSDDPALFLDFMVGLWAFSRDLTQMVEALAGPIAASEVHLQPELSSVEDGPILR